MVERRGVDLKTITTADNVHRSSIFFVLIVLFLFAVSLATLSTSNAAATLYVNGTSGNDTYDGTSPTWVSGTIGPKKTIQNASNSVDTSGTVNVASGTYNEHITIGKSLNLIGANPVNTIIDGTNNGRPLTINAPINVIIANFTIRNGASTDFGGAIYKYEGELTITNSNIIGNKVTNPGSDGGAIYNVYGGLTIINSTLTGNNATVPGGDGANGGAIYNSDGTVNIINSTLTGNTAQWGGGAIYNYNWGAVTITNSNLSGNSLASTYSGGGAIYNYGAVTITNSTLNGNPYGAIYNYGAVTITNSTLNGNPHGAIYNTAGYYDFFSFIVGTVNIINSTFTGNTRYQGGAICNSGTVTITGSNLSGNNALNGGAIYNYFDWSILPFTDHYNNIVTIINSTLTGNTAINPPDDSCGGAIYNDGILTITGSTLSGNNATFGGAIFNYFDTYLNEEYWDIYWNELTMHYNRVANNSPNAIYNTGADVYVQYNWWGSNSNPSTQFSGSGIQYYSPWLYMNLTASPTFIFRGSTSTLTANFNNAYDGSTVTPIDPAGGHLPDGSPVTFTTNLGNVGSKTTIKNTTNGVATAILTANEGIGAANITARLDNQTLYTVVGIETLYVNGATGNNAWNGLSPTYVSGTTGPMQTIQTAVNSIITGGTVMVASGTYNEHLTISKNLNLIGAGQGQTFIDGTHNGIVINIPGSFTVNITGVTIRNGNSTSDGGGIYNRGTLTITSSTLSGNTANGFGGAIYNNMGTVNLISSILTGNSVAATYGGGAIYNMGTVTITNSTLSGNTASVGGAISNPSAGKIINIINSTLSGNTATIGGAIYNLGTLTISESILSGNTASSNGGSLYNAGIATLHFNRIINNSPNAIATSLELDALYNWWGSNSDPSSQFSGTVNYSPWLYMTLTANPSLILNGATSTLTASFNNIYNGDIVKPNDPADGHLPDSSLVTFTTDLGNVGSKITTKGTVNGIATAILTADEGTGTANITAQLDSQTLNTNVLIKDLYVNDATGDDAWDGLSPTYIGGNTGPMKTIRNALNAVNNGGTIYVASGTYVEDLVIEIDVNLIGTGTNSILTPPNPNDEIITIAEKVKKVMISGFTIQGATSGTGIAIKGNGVIVKDNNIFDNDRGITIGGEIEKVIISGNNIKHNNMGIYSSCREVKINFNSIFENNVDIYTEIENIDATFNWWGSNSAPEILNVINSPWLYMTLSTNPDVILNGGTSEIIASFNNGFDGETVTPIDPVDGHLQDNSIVTFSTDLGNLGSKTTTKNTTNGIATATLTANEAPGTATVSVEFDNELLNSPVIIVPARYVNGLTGDDTYDGSSPVWISGLIGPMRTIQTAVNAVEASGVVSVASGTYNENIVVDKLVQIINGGSGIVTVRASNAILSVFLINPAGSGTIIRGLNITGGSTGIYINGAGNCNLTGNNLTGNSWSGIGISGAQGTLVENNNVFGNQEGIYILNGATNNIITGNTISGNQFSGVCVDTSYNTNISGNGLISGNSNGIRLYHATGNVVSGNNLPANLWCAIVLDGSSNNHITGSNALTYNVEGIHLMNNANNNIINGTTITGNSSSWCGISVWASTGNNLTNNSVTGNQEGIYVTQGASYNTVSQNNINNNLNSAICLDQNSQHNNIQNNTNINLNGNGIRLYQATLNTITLNTITQSVWAAICLDNANSNNVSWNTVSSNQEGIYIFNNANNNIIFHNTATNNAYSGICVNSATGNNLTGNTISLNGNGIRLYNYADNNNITSNTISQQGWAGIVIDSSHQNQIHYNTIQSNGEGLYSMNGSNNNHIYYNNFITNTNHNAYEDGTTNIYDDGSTGNYWSDYSGIGMYFIQIGNVDRHPV
jgi:parallel beta-helix repeat protein